ncbi:MAG TPA: RNA polymerase sigma factor [Gemmatimonadaceae bacterium]|nr:RNA polymerase sigma factor [Gemmatimonadaceae bacterium]
MTDALLVRRALAGDESAFTALVDRHAPVCLRYAARMLGNREDAEDATQETLLRAFRSLHAYHTERPFRTWLMTILVNRCRSAALLRGRREARVVANSDALADAALATEPDWLTDETPRIEAALAELEPRQREAFLLKHVEQLEYEEMAAITGASVSALKMRVKRACERLRARLATHGGVE